MKNLYLAVTATVGSIVLAGCSGAYGPGGFNGYNVCNTGTQEQTANPLPNQTGVNPNMGSVIVVANSNTNTLYTTYTQWQVELVDQFNNVTTGGSLSLVPDPSGPHPYASDFYYQSSISTLTVGRTYTVELNETSTSCQPVAIGQFST